MNILESVGKALVKTTPDVWVGRIALFSKLSGSPIRDVPLHPGLNIVWAEEPDGEDDNRDIAGHSAGKTSFSRLLRYVLGEITFGNNDNMGLIKSAFPSGYVGAELFVKGAKWAVLRPLGENRSSYVLRDGSIEDLIADRSEAAYQDTYPGKIGLDALLEPLASATVVRTDQPIKWGHLLAWCARDQEARFQNIYDWRSPRSDSQSPAFRFSKADPLFVMRVVLGLFLEDELAGEEELSNLKQAQEKAEGDLEIARKEPVYWREHYELAIRRQLQSILPGDASAVETAPILSSDMAPDLQRYVRKAKFIVSEQIDQLAVEQKRIQEQVDASNERIAANKRELKVLEALFQLHSKAEGEVAAGLRRDEEFQQKASELKNTLCLFGDVLIGNCDYVLKRQQRLSTTAIKDAQTLEQQEAARASEAAKITARCEKLLGEVQAQERTRTGLTTEQTRLTAEALSKGRLQESLDLEFESLQTWKAREQSPDAYEKLKEQIQKIDTLRKQVETKEGELNRLISQHETNRELLNRIFSTCARNVLPSPNYDGKVSLEERELHFQITKRGTMSGEAMETLAVLLGDFSCLIYNAFSGQSHLPGFLLHDSPREADLGLRLYRSYFRFVAQLETEFAASGGCPFQYIITTTTPPPGNILDDKHVVLQLDASEDNGLLFRRDLTRPPESQQPELIH
jgi:hypothetical protein